MKITNRQLLLFLSIVLLSSCTVFYDDALPNQEISKYPERVGVINKAITETPPAEKKPIVAVYPTSFTDQTGQRRSNNSFATFSTAVTQAPYVLLIKTLKEVSGGEFFEVVERVGLDNLTKERQLIRSTRESFEEDSRVKPLLLAGLLMQGGVLSIDTNVRSGGAGARYLGIGSSKEYREDLITISLRLVSVSTGEVLIEVLTTKSILSVGLSQDIFRFLDESTRLIEVEGGVSANESTSIALQKAIEDRKDERTKIQAESKSIHDKNYSPKVLNLFGYSGLASLHAASHGASVTHIDASKKAINFAFENRNLSSFQDLPIKFITDDAIKFVKREIRRENKYDGIILDPPKYGRGPNGEKWDFFNDLPILLKLITQILTPEPIFIILNSYAIRSSHLTLYFALNETMKKYSGKVESGELCIVEDQEDPRQINTAIFARWEQQVI